MLSNYLTKKAVELMITYQPDIPQKEKEIKTYRIANMFYNVDKIIILLFIAYLLGIAKYILLMFAATFILRIYSRGIHVSSWLICTVWGFINYIGGYFLAKYIHINSSWLTAVFVLCACLYYIHAPKSTTNLPILKKSIQPMKSKALITLAAYYVIALVIGESIYRNIITLSVIGQLINILPVTYKIFKIKENYI